MRISYPSIRNNWGNSYLSKEALYRVLWEFRQVQFFSLLKKSTQGTNFSFLRVVILSKEEICPLGYVERWEQFLSLCVVSVNPSFLASICDLSQNQLIYFLKRYIWLGLPPSGLKWSPKFMNFYVFLWCMARNEKNLAIAIENKFWNLNDMFLLLSCFKYCLHLIQLISDLGLRRKQKEIYSGILLVRWENKVRHVPQWGWIYLLFGIMAGNW